MPIEKKFHHAKFWGDLGKHMVDPVEMVEVYEDLDGERWMVVTDTVACARQPMPASFACGAWKPEKEYIQVAIPRHGALYPLSYPALATAEGPADSLLRALLPFVPNDKKDRARFTLVLGLGECRAEEAPGFEELHGEAAVVLHGWKAIGEYRIILDARRLRQMIKASGAVDLELHYRDKDHPLLIEGDTLSGLLMPINI